LEADFRPGGSSTCAAGRGQAQRQRSINSGVEIDMQQAAAVDKTFTWIAHRIPCGYPIEWREKGDTAVGDLLLCEVRKVGLHGRIETSAGARSKLYPGDRIICSPGARYATAMLEGLPEVRGAEADLLSASGVCGRVTSVTSGFGRPTQLAILAQAFSQGRALNLRDFAIESPPPSDQTPRLIVVVGSDMDAGKTTTCCSVIHGLARQGHRVAAAKLTGTASSRDVGSFRDAGASPVFDFLDCGWPSTAGCSSAELASVAADLIGALSASGAEYAVLEIADGLLQRETSALLEILPEIAPHATVLLAARESLSAIAGADRLARAGYRVAAISGLVSSSALTSREVETAIGIPCLSPDDLVLRADSLGEASDPAPGLRP
jgi:hypothetical protein